MSVRSKPVGIAALTLGLLWLMTGSAMAASEFHTEYSDYFTVTSTPVSSFEINAGEDTLVNCSAPTTTAPMQEKRVTALDFSGGVYSNCQNQLFVKSLNVNLSNCGFRLRSNGVADVWNKVCGGLYSIWYFGKKCEIRLRTQTGLQWASYTNVGTGTGRKIKATYNLEKVNYYVENGNCIESPGPHDNGSFRGTVELSASTPYGPVGIWIE